jgi:hypothetical protein
LTDRGYIPPARLVLTATPEQLSGLLRSRLLLLLLVATALLASEGEAQRTRRVRKKPFEEFSKSAQRLKASLTGHTVVPFGETIQLNVDSLTVRDSIAAAAYSQLGTRYVYGADQPGRALDCSSFVRFVMSALRLELPRTANEQAKRGVQVVRDPKRLLPGDLLTFGRRDSVTHIGVYVGDGRFVHASTTQRRVVEASIDEPGTWFRRNWMGVRRLLATAEHSDSTG